MKMNVAIRGFVGKKVIFDDRVDVNEATLSELLPRLAEKHAIAMATHELHMIEIEFLDEPDPLARFFRFGTDPSRMTIPFGIKL
jgi:hypothetical protein